MEIHVVFDVNSVSVSITDVIAVDHAPSTRSSDTDKAKQMQRSNNTAWDYHSLAAFLNCSILINLWIIIDRYNDPLCQLYAIRTALYSKQREDYDQFGFKRKPRVSEVMGQIPPPLLPLKPCGRPLQVRLWYFCL